MEEIPNRDRYWAIGAHLAPLVGAIIPTAHILLPLAVLLFGPKSEFVRAHVKESLNAQIAYTAYLLLIIFLWLTAVGLVVAIPFGVLVTFMVIWNMIMGAIQAGRGKGYAYRMIFRLVP